MPGSDSIAATFEQVALKFPEACALRWSGGAWSYAELNARANRLAHFLIGAGVRAETPVGVFAARSAESLLAFLAILKAGGAYVPLDPTHPADRIKYYLEDAAISLVLADPKEIAKLPANSARVVPLDAKLAADEPETNPANACGPHSLAHILFTSGSTGRPKGVMIEHRGVLRLTAHVDYMDLAPGETLLQYAPLGFDISTFEIWAVWLNGACVAVPPAGLTSLHDLGVAIRTFDVSRMTLTAGLMALMVEQEIDSLAGVRQLLTGGEVVSPVHAERFLRKYPGARLINAYGPTENSVLTSCHRIQLEDPMPTRLSIGRPIAKTGVLILDEKLQPVPQGELGEMVMTGEGVARGYLNQPQLTEQSFVQVVDASGATVRGYRSGDLGRYREDGTLDFHGRRDDQVKINGIRIEPGEIRNILQSHPHISGAEVVLAQNGGRKYLEIFAVPAPGAAVEERALRDFLRQKIPGNWLPPLIRIVPDLPLNPNGKVDRRALLEGLSSAPEARKVGVEEEPDDLLERMIWNIWRELLPDASITRRDRFSDLGGESMSALLMLARVEKMVGRHIGLMPLLEGGTIADLAAAVRRSDAASPVSLMIRTQAGGDKPPLFFAHGDYICGGLYCQRMALHLGADQPLYALAPHGTFGGELPPDFESAAASYVEMIRSAQPKGPYYLGGFCNGAVAMYEAAQQLIRAGETVDVLILLDPPDLNFHHLRRLTALGRLLGFSGEKYQDSFLRLASPFELWRQDGTPAMFVRAVRWMMKRGLRLFKTESPEVTPPSYLAALNFHVYKTIAAYRPRAYPGSGTVRMILREGERHRAAGQLRYWKKFVPEVSSEFIPGTHLELSGNVKELAEVITKALNDQKGRLSPRKPATSSLVYSATSA
jgi:amino acid adenylation domain-containing protein